MGAQGVIQRFFINQLSACGINEVGGGLHHGKLFLTDKIGGFRGRRAVQRNEVALFENTVKIVGEFYAFGDLLLGFIRIVGDNFHIKAMQRFDCHA